MATYRVLTTEAFSNSIRQLQKRFRHVVDDVRVAVEELRDDPDRGPVIPQSGGIRKVRVANSDAGRGKSGGYRLLYFVQIESTSTIFLLLLYSKSDREDVDRETLRNLLNQIG